MLFQSLFFRLFFCNSLSFSTRCSSLNEFFSTLSVISSVLLGNSPLISCNFLVQGLDLFIQSFLSVDTTFTRITFEYPEYNRIKYSLINAAGS